jgi:hypothetical protein
MPSMGIERRNGTDQTGPDHRADEVARSREGLVGETAAAIGPQALTASMRGKTVVRKEFIMHALGDEAPTVVPERTIDNFWRHKPA